MDDEERNAMFNTFASIADNMGAEAVPCELEGHYDSSKPEHEYHDKVGVKWREWFFCPYCGEEQNLLVCDSAHEEIMHWAEEEVDKPDFFYCGTCDEDWEFMDVYNGGFPWG